MNKAYRIILLAFLLLLPACSLLPVLPGQTDIQATKAVISTPELASIPALPPSALFDLPWQDRSPFRQGLLPESQHWADALSNASLYRVELSIPPEVDVLTGRQEVLYTNQETHALDTLVLRLFANVNGGSIQVSSLQVNEQPVEGILQSRDSAMRIQLAAPLQPGERLLLQLDFSIEIPREVGGNYGLFGYFDDVLMLDLFLPTIPAYDSEGWYLDPPPEYGDLSYYDASYYLLRVNAPESMTLVASGIEIERVVEDGLQQVTFANGPARDLSLAASEDFTVLTGETGGVQVNSYTFAGMEEARALALESAIQAIEIFSERIGGYDYTEFDVIATPMLAGGIEYPGMTWINQDYYNLGREFSGLPASVILENVIAHEVGHQWFYNAVGNSQVDEPWLDEALVQYITGLYFLERYDEAAYQGVQDSWDSRWANIAFEEMPIGLPSYQYEGYDYVAAVYGRGPYFFEALSAKMGAEDFRAFLSDYYTRFRWEIATGPELKELAEAHCRCSLDALFSEWVLPK